mgnify:CR=1 FL=1
MSLKRVDTAKSARSHADDDDVDITAVEELKTEEEKKDDTTPVPYYKLFR